MQDARSRVEQRLGLAGVRVSDAQLDQLSGYLILLDKWNQRMNLTALDDPDAVSPQMTVYASRAPACDRAGEGLPRFDLMPTEMPV